MGRPRESGSERWATVTEAAEALGITQQAIYNRIKAETIPYEQHIEEGKPSYRIDRAWVNAEVARKRKGMPATVNDAQERTLDILTAVQSLGEHFIEELKSGDAKITGAIQEQVRQVVPRLDALAGFLEKTLENQTKVMGNLEEMRNNQSELYKQIREATARAEEANRRAQEADLREREYQQENLELQRELRDLVKDARETAGVARRDREGAGQPERRSWWRRMFGD